MNARALVVLVAAVAMVTLTARLAVWQLDRATQKQALQRSLDERRGLPALPAAGLARDAAAAAAQHDRSIVLQGRWLGAATVYLDNRQMNGRPGFFVVTPLQLVDGSAVVVQRGWLPRDPLERTRITPPATPAGDVRVRGRIAPPPGRLYEFDASASGAIRQNLHIDGYAREFGLLLHPLSVVQQDDTAIPSDGLLRQWPQPAADIQKHYGYAFQWFALSALTAALYVWFQLIRPRRRR